MSSAGRHDDDSCERRVSQFRNRSNTFASSTVTACAIGAMPILGVHMLVGESRRLTTLSWRLLCVCPVVALAGGLSTLYFGARWRQDAKKAAPSVRPQPVQ